MTKRALLVIATVAIIGATAAITFAVKKGGTDAVPTEAQARAALDAKYRQAQSGDREAYCSDTWSPEMCQSQWDRLGGPSAVPHTPPRVVDTREQDGYRVLQLCGTDGQGHPYRTDFVLGIENARLTLVFPPVFWYGTTFSGVHGDNSPRQDTAEGTSTTACS